MKRWKRKLFLLLAVTVFLLVSPLAILYTSGYRYDFKTKSIKKIGMFIVESTPKEVDIYIDGVYKADKTPYKKTKLFPEVYNVKLTRDGYNSWEKNLSVDSKTVTWVNDARLFLAEPTATKIGESSVIKEFSLSLDYKKIAYIDEVEQLWLVNIKNQTREKLYPVETNVGKIIKGIQWSPNSNKILINSQSATGNQPFVIDINNPGNSTKVNIQNTDKITWDLQDENFLYALRNQNLIGINLNKSDNPTIIASQIKNYAIHASNIYLLKNNPKNKKLTLCRLAKNQTEINNQSEIITEIDQANYKIGLSEKGTIALLSNDGALMIVKNGTVKEISSAEIVDFSWSADEESLLYHSDNEIWFYKFSTDDSDFHPEYKLNESNLLTRYSTKIMMASWYPDKEHIVFNANNRLLIEELDSRDNNNIFELSSNITDLKKDSFYTDKKGKTIYYLSNQRGKDIIWEKVIY